ncbi:MAG TPA: sulfotransferase [Burkholderiales bacterium]|nr:sulfotransferase [Burkholderiales bacterium]
MTAEKHRHAAAHLLQAGLALRARGKLAEAEDRLGRAISADPLSGAAHSALASLLIAGGRHRDAVSHVEAALALDAGDSEAQHCLGLLFLERALLEPAIDAFARCTVLDPARVDAWRNLAAAQRSLGRPREARATLERALRHLPGEPGLLASLAALCEFFGEHERVFEILGPRVAAGHCAVEELMTLTRSLQAVERHPEARQLLETALAGCAARDRYRIEFALGELLDRAGEYEAAFAHVQRANAGKQARFDAKDYRRYVDGIIDGYLRLRARGAPGAGCDSRRPVFIVGMPRSGTSLLEQIVAAHPDVAGAGELGAIPLLAQTAEGARPRPGGTQDLPAAELRRLADAYLGRLEAVDSSSPRVTDKMWENFEYLGFIERLFPKARVIHCRRDPLDIAVSCYFQHFSGRNGVAFAYDLGHIGAFHREYERLMDFWKRESSLGILDVQYENVVGGLETQARRVIAFLGLDWSEACLRFHAEQRTVNTASYAQVRRPVYASSIGRWRHYRRHLEAFAQVAGVALPA